MTKEGIIILCKRLNGDKDKYVVIKGTCGRYDIVPVGKLRDEYEVIYRHGD